MKEVNQPKKYQNPAKNKLTNIETILSDRKTGLPDERIDVASLYDVFHDLTDPKGVLEELHRVLKLDGILSLSDHHLKQDENAFCKSPKTFQSGGECLNNSSFFGTVKARLIKLVPDSL